MVPVPVLFTAPAPEITPEKVMLELSPPVVSAPEPRATLPAPASEPIVWSKPFRSSVAPLETV
jgi:hypothetical protein